MAEETYDELILRGETARETGNVLKAIPIFLKAFEAAQESSEKSNANRQLGLCFEHARDLLTARRYYVEALEYSREGKDLGGMARAKRHLLSIELRQGNFEKALRLGKRARSLMFEMTVLPTDLVSVTHGIVKTYIDGRYSKTLVRVWAKKSGTTFCICGLLKTPNSQTCLVYRMADGSLLTLGSLVVAITRFSFFNCSFLRIGCA